MLFCLFAGLYPEIPEGSQLDFSALKEEVPLLASVTPFIYLFSVCFGGFFFKLSIHTLSLCFDWQGEWLLLFNYLIPFSELLDQSGQALDCEGAGARVNIKTEQVSGLRWNSYQNVYLTRA